MFRFCIAVCVIVSALLFPWWVTLALLLYASFRFPPFVEGVIAGFLIDMQYASHPLWGTTALMTVLATLICFLMLGIRRHIRYETLASSH
jgi:hypothetical protein